jgi:hypothetical protein
MTTIDFKDIRTHKGSQHEGFEELCCQLASFEEVPKDSIFRRKSGAGGDATGDYLMEMRRLGKQNIFLMDWDLVNGHKLMTLLKRPWINIQI